MNFRQVSLLIKNMPLDNMERYGRIKDTIPFILGAVDGKVRSLDLHHLLMNQAESMSKSVDAIGKTLSNLTTEVSKGQERVSEIIRYLLTDLDFHLPRLGLEADQEKYIIEKITVAFNDTLAQMNHSSHVSQSLEDIVRLLQHLATQQKRLVDTSFVEETPASIKPNDGEVYSSDVELF